MGVRGRKRTKISDKGIVGAGNGYLVLVVLQNEGVWMVLMLCGQLEGFSWW